MAAEKTQQQLQFDKMTKTPIPRLVMGLAVPTILSMLITSIYNLADTFFVGQISTSASGAVGVVSSLMAVIQAIGFMLGHGAGSIISRKLGSGDAPAASRFASTSFFTAIGAGAALGVFGIAGLTPLMRLLGSTETILPHARDYAFYILLAAPFMMSSLVMNNILRYEGKASFAMIGLVTGGVLNMVLDPVFIFGLGMGTGGAGLATGLSQIVGFCILLSMYLRGKTVSKLSIRNYTRSGRDIIAILTIGLPSFGRQGLASFASMMLNVAARSYGDAAVAAMSIVSRIFQFLQSVALGVGQGFQPVASYNYGAHKFHRVRSACLFTIGASAVGLPVHHRGQLCPDDPAGRGLSCQRRGAGPPVPGRRRRHRRRPAGLPVAVHRHRAAAGAGLRQYAVPECGQGGPGHLPVLLPAGHLLHPADSGAAQRVGAGRRAVLSAHRRRAQLCGGGALHGAVPGRAGPDGRPRPRRAAAGISP